MKICGNRNIKPGLVEAAINAANRAARTGAEADKVLASKATSKLTCICSSRGIDSQKVMSRIEAIRIAGEAGFHIEARLDLVEPLVVSVVK